MLLCNHVTHLSKLLLFIVKEYFAPLTSTLIVFNSTWIQQGLVQEEYLQGTLHAFQNYSIHDNFMGLKILDVARMRDDEFQHQILQSVDKTVVQGFITILPNTSKFLHARYFATRNSNIRLKDKVYLFLCMQNEIPRDFLKNELLQFYPNHLMIRPVEIGGNIFFKTIQSKNINMGGYHCQHLLVLRNITFEMWTQKFVGSFGNLDALLLNTFLPNETFMSHQNATHNENRTVELYPDKLKNLDGRDLRLGSLTYVPYTITNYVPTGTGNYDSVYPNGGNRSISFFGAEANIMKTFCQIHNCHLRVESYGADNWGSIYENETGNGMLVDVYTQRLEAAIGCIYNWYDNIMEVSHPIARSSVTILGPAPALFPAWRTNTLPFDRCTWIFLAFTIITSSYFLYILKYSTYCVDKTKYRIDNFSHMCKLQKSLLEIFALFIQQPSAPTTFDRLAPRLFLASLLSATITLENIYSGQLKSLLTIPFYDAAVDNVEKWTASNWKWAAPSVIWVQSIKDSNLTQDQVLIRNFEVRDYDFLYNASFKPDYGLGIEHLICGAYTFGNYITPAALENRIVLRDDIYFDWTRAVSIRGWALMPLLNTHIRHCLEVGLYVHWELIYTSKYLDKTIEEILLKLASGYHNKSSPMALNLQNISGALFVLYGGYLIALVTFLLEKIYFFKQKIYRTKYEEN